MYSTLEVHETEPPFHNEYRQQGINFYTVYIIVIPHFTMKLHQGRSLYSTQEVHETEPPSTMNTDYKELTSTLGIT